MWLVKQGVMFCKPKWIMKYLIEVGREPFDRKMLFQTPSFFFNNSCRQESIQLNGIIVSIVCFCRSFSFYLQHQIVPEDRRGRQKVARAHPTILFVSQQIQKQFFGGSLLLILLAANPVQLCQSFPYLLTKEAAFSITEYVLRTF